MGFRVSGQTVVLTAESARVETISLHHTNEDIRQFLNTLWISQLSSFSSKEETALIVRSAVRTGIQELSCCSVFYCSVGL